MRFTEFSKVATGNTGNGKEVPPRMKAVGEKLRRIRIGKGYAGYDFFAWEHGLSPRQYLNMEQGKNFTMASLVRVLDIHGMSLEEFFAGLK